MRRKIKFKSVLLNIFVTLVCLTIFAESLWFFFKDLSYSSLRSDKDAIATITFKYKIAQRKFDDRVVWERLQQDAPLYAGDTIRTADLAQATIHFEGGTDIEIGENSMVQLILSEDGGVKLSVSGGQIDVDTTNAKEAVSLDMGTGVVVSLEAGSKLSAKLDEASSDVGLKVTAGNATLQTVEDGVVGGAETLSAGESVKVNESGNVTKTPITVTSVSDNQRILIFDEDKSKTSVPLEWFPLEKSDEKVVVQTSSTKDFSKIKNTVVVSDINKVDIPADDGPVYWRVFLEDDKDNSVEGKILFESVSKIILTSPEKDSAYNYYNEKPKINFSWRGNNYSIRYRLEIGKRASLENPEFVKELSGQNFVVPDLDEGTYYWRITPYYETNGIGWTGETEIRTFSITKREKLLPPTLTIPIEGRKFLYKEDVIDADFTWKGENVASEYTLQISSDENFSRVIFSKDTKEKSIHESIPVSNFPDGDYFWRILQKASVSQTETENLVSQARKFSVSKYIPAQNKLLYPDDSYSVEKSNLRSLKFMWKISAENEATYAADKTRIQFSTTDDFSRPVLEREVSDSADASIRNISLDAGKYFWRIKKGDSVTDVRTLLVLEKLLKPEITFPSPDEKLLLREDENVVITWKKVSDADYYKVRVIDSGTKDVITEVSEITSERLPVSLDVTKTNERKFIVQVQALTNETKLVASRKSEFSETRFSAKIPSVMRLVSPAPNSRIDGLAALKEDVTLKWEKGDDAYLNATLKLWKVGTGGQLRLIETFKNPRESVNISRLGSGSYKWTVSAENKDGVSLDAESPWDFVVTDVPKLDSPVLDSPARNLKIDAAYLKKNRSITFAWKPVRGATDYTMVLYQKLPNGSLKKIYSSENQKGTQVKLKDLTILDIGNFQWQVTAQNRARDGFVYQEGKVASQEFKIDFSLPKKVEVVNPGEMYGE